MASASDVWKSPESNSGGRVEKSTRVELGAASWRGLRLLAVPEGIAASRTGGRGGGNRTWRATWGFGLGCSVTRALTLTLTFTPSLTFTLTLIISHV